MPQFKSIPKRQISQKPKEVFERTELFPNPSTKLPSPVPQVKSCVVKVGKKKPKEKRRNRKDRENNTSGRKKKKEVTFNTESVKEKEVAKKDILDEAVKLSGIGEDDVRVIEDFRLDEDLGEEPVLGFDLSLLDNEDKFILFCTDWMWLMLLFAVEIQSYYEPSTKCLNFYISLQNAPMETGEARDVRVESREGEKLWRDLLEEEERQYTRTHFRYDDPTQAPTLSRHVLKQCTNLDKIHGYFSNFEDRKCRLTVVGGSRLFSSIQVLRKQDGECMLWNSPAAAYVTYEHSVPDNGSLSDKEFESYSRALLCAYYPKLTAPEALVDCTPVPSNDMEQQGYSSGYCDSGSELDHATPAAKTRRTLKQAGAASILEISGSFAGVGQNEADQSVAVVPPEALCDWLKNAFGLSEQSSKMYMRKTYEQYRKKKDEKILIEELCKQLSLLEKDEHPFYSPDTFFSRQAYNDWQQKQRVLIGQMMNKFWMHSLPPLKAGTAVYDVAQYHTCYKTLFHKLSGYEAYMRGSRSASQPLIALSSASTKLLQEFAFRYGIGDVFRQLVLLQTITDNFNREFGIVSQAVSTLQTVISLVSPQRAKFVLVVQEYKALEDILDNLQEQCKHAFSRIKRAFDDTARVNGIEYMTKLLHEVVRARHCLGMDSRLEQSPKIQQAKSSTSAIRTDSQNQTRFVERAVADLLCAYTKDNLEAEYGRFKVLAMTDLGIALESQLVTAKLINRLITYARDEVLDYERHYARAYQRYADITQVAASVTYELLMGDVQALCDQAQLRKEWRGVDLSVLSVAYRLNDVDRTWRAWISPEQQSWRACFEHQFLHWMAILDSHMTQFILLSIGSDEFLPVESGGEFERATETIGDSRCASTQSQVSLAASEYSAFSVVRSFSSLQILPSVCSQTPQQGAQVQSVSLEFAHADCSESPQTQRPNMQSPQRQGLQVQDPKMQSLQTQRSHMRSPQAQGLHMQDPEMQSPQTEKPHMQSPQVQGLQTQSPRTQNLRARISQNAANSEYEKENWVKSIGVQSTKTLRGSRSCPNVKQQYESSNLQSASKVSSYNNIFDVKDKERDELDHHLPEYSEPRTVNVPKKSFPDLERNGAECFESRTRCEHSYLKPEFSLVSQNETCQVTGERMVSVDAYQTNEKKQTSDQTVPIDAANSSVQPGAKEKTMPVRILDSVDDSGTGGKLDNCTNGPSQKSPVCEVSAVSNASDIGLEDTTGIDLDDPRSFEGQSPDNSDEEVKHTFPDVEVVSYGWQSASGSFGLDNSFTASDQFGHTDLKGAVKPVSFKTELPSLMPASEIHSASMPDIKKKRIVKRHRKDQRYTRDSRDEGNSHFAEEISYRPESVSKHVISDARTSTNRIAERQVIASLSYIEFRCLINRLVHSVKGFCEAMYPLPSAVRDELTTTENTHREKMISLRLKFQGYLVTVVSRCVKLYSYNVLGMDLCGERTQTAKRLVGQRLVGETKSLHTSKNIWGCRHMKSGSSCYSYIDKKATFLADKHEPISVQMCCRIDNIVKLESHLSDIESHLVQSLNAHDVIEAAEGSGIALAESSSSQFGECRRHLRLVWTALVTLLVHRINLFMKEALSLLVELDAPPGTTMEKRYGPAIGFFKAHAHLLTKWLPSVAYDKAMRSVWIDFVEDIKRLVEDLIRRKVMTITVAEQLMQLIAHMLVQLREPELRFDLEFASAKMATCLDMLHVCTLPTPALINIYTLLQSYQEEIAGLRDEEKVALAYLQRMCSDLHKQRKWFSGLDLVTWILTHWFEAPVGEADTDSTDTIVNGDEQVRSADERDRDRPIEVTRTQAKEDFTVGSDVNETLLADAAHLHEAKILAQSLLDATAIKVMDWQSISSANNSVIFRSCDDYPPIVCLSTPSLSYKLSAPNLAGLQLQGRAMCSSGSYGNSEDEHIGPGLGWYSPILGRNSRQSPSQVEHQHTEQNLKMVVSEPLLSAMTSHGRGVLDKDNDKDNEETANSTLEPSLQGSAESSVQGSMTTEPLSVTSSMFQSTANQLYYFAQLIEHRQNFLLAANATETLQRSDASHGGTAARGRVRSDRGAPAQTPRGEDSVAEPPRAASAPVNSRSGTEFNQLSDSGNIYGVSFENIPIQQDTTLVQGPSNRFDAITSTLRKLSSKKFNWMAPICYRVSEEFVLSVIYNRRYRDQQASRFLATLPNEKLFEYSALFNETDSTGCFSFL